MLVVEQFLLVDLGDEQLQQLGDVAIALVHGRQDLSRRRRRFLGHRCS